MDDRFTLRIDHVDREEWTVYLWGEIENGTVVTEFEDGTERFGSLSDQLERVQPVTDRAAPTEWWLEANRSVGTMGQRPRARATHPLVQRELGYSDYQCVAVLRGFDRETSTVESIVELATRNREGELTLNIGFVVPTSTPNPEDATVQTCANIFTALVTQPFPQHSEQPLSDRVVITAYRFERNIGQVAVDSEKLYAREDAVETDELAAITERLWIDDPTV
jgi:hypothetical protein